MDYYEVKAEKVSFFIDVLLKWETYNFVAFPWRSAPTQWHSLAAEIMLQRTKAEQVVPIYNKFVNKYPTPESFLQDSNSETFKSLGLPEREGNLRKLASIIAETGIPLQSNELIALPGVGPYIAAAFRSLHLDIPDIIIDSNVVRLYGRYFGFETHSETRRKKWFIDFTKNIIPLDDHRIYNYALLDFTRAICTPKPKCTICPLDKQCSYFKSTH